jgi:hypothetical protein
MPMIGNLELGMIPRIAVPMTDTELRCNGARAVELGDVLKLRIDQFEQHDPSYVRDVCEKARGYRVPLLATVRSSRKRRAVSLSDSARMATPAPGMSRPGRASVLNAGVGTSYPSSMKEDPSRERPGGAPRPSRGLFGTTFAGPDTGRSVKIRS